MAKKKIGGLDSIFESSTETPATETPTTETPTTETPITETPTTEKPITEITQEFTIGEISINSILGDIDKSDMVKESDTATIHNTKVVEIDGKKYMDTTQKVESVKEQKTASSPPVDIKEYDNILTSGVAMYVETLDLFVSKVCGAISSEDSEKYKMSKTEKSDYMNISKVYFSSMKIKVNPTTIFIFATVIFVGGNLVKSIMERFDKAKKAKKIDKIIERTSENALIKSYDKNELIEKLRQTDECARGRVNFEVIGDGSYKYAEKTKTFPLKIDRVKASPEILSALNSGMDSKIICELMYKNVE